MHTHTQITVLIDNNKSCTNENLACEHGLSLWIEHNGQKILCDTGVSNQFIENAQHLSIDPSHADYIVISHGHNDHTGGIEHMLENNSISKSILCISNNLLCHHYYSNRNNKIKKLTCGALNSIKNYKNTKCLTESEWIEPNSIALVYTSEHKFAKPNGNKYLISIKLNYKFDDYSKIKADSFDHEVSIALITNKGLIIIAPCSHNGAANIIESCKKFTKINDVHAYIGGLHYIDDQHIDSSSEVFQLSKDLSIVAPMCKVFTGHCTGSKAINYIKTSKENLNIDFFQTGTVLKF